MKSAIFSLFFVFHLAFDLDIDIESIFKCINKKLKHTLQKWISFIWWNNIHQISTPILGQQPLAFISGGHLGRHLGFLSPHQQWPLYPGRFINFRVWQTFWYITFNVVLWSPPHLQLSLESHPTNCTEEIPQIVGLGRKRLHEYVTSFKRKYDVALPNATNYVILQ